MARIALAPLLLLQSLLYFTISAIASDTTFIQTSCKSTRYPAVCVQSLLPYANEIQQNTRRLDLTALSVSLSGAKSTKLLVTKLQKFKKLKHMEIAALADCSVLMDWTVDLLSKSIQEMKNMGQAKDKDFWRRFENIQTWASGALTSEDTCIDDFAGKAMDGEIKDSITRQVGNLAQVTDNALTLINELGATK